MDTNNSALTEKLRIGFKVGDFVKHGRSLHRVLAVDINTNTGDYICIVNIDNFKDTWLPQSKFKLWSPTPTEWCWFDKNKLGRFWKKQGTRYYYTLSEFTPISDKTLIPTGEFYVTDYCEPFIGIYPSFIGKGN